MYKDAVIVGDFKLNPRAKKWLGKIPQLRTASRKILRKIYKKYYGVSPHGFTKFETYLKVAYYFQRVAYKIRHIKKRKKFRRYVKSIIKADPIKLRSILRNSIFETNFKKEGGDNMGKSNKKRAGVSGKKRTQDKKKESISSIVYRMIKAGEKDKAIIKAVKKIHPDSKINSVHMNWYRAQLKSKRKGASAVKKLKGKKRKKTEEEEEEEEEEDEDEDEDEDDE